MTEGGRDWVRVLLVAALAVLVGGAVFSAVAAEIWVEHWPAWVQRVSSGGLLGGVLLVAVAGSVWVIRRRRPG